MEVQRSQSQRLQELCQSDIEFQFLGALRLKTNAKVENNIFQ